MIRVGTCSWTEKTLIQSGEFYPKNVKTSEARLRYYSEHFDTVEVDSSYYAIPDRKTAYLWDERTPDNFIFHIKAYRALTGHGVDPKTLPKDIANSLPEKDRNGKLIYIKEPSILDELSKRFRELLTPLVKSKKLGVIVFQFPPWFQYSKSKFDFILECKSKMKNLQVAVEFRHGSWLEPARRKFLFSFLRENDLTYITADEPQYGTNATIPFVPEVTTDIAYIRFHGRNSENWLKKGIETSLRYSYEYSDSELRGFIPAIYSLNKRAKLTCAMFNNCHGGFAIKNALMLKKLIDFVYM